ncbi:MAG: hypothetical protein GYB31_20730 [Bacteroidetes bacterium]|nr:hypothetical protein [Bacteroidota bacterium]
MTGKLLSRLLAFLLFCFLLLLLGGNFFIRHKLVHKLDNLSEKGIMVQYQKLETGIFSGEILLEGVTLDFFPDSLSGVAPGEKAGTFTAGKLTGNGISWIDLIRNKTLKLNSLQLEDYYLENCMSDSISRTLSIGEGGTVFQVGHLLFNKGCYFQTGPQGESYPALQIAINRLDVRELRFEPENKTLSYAAGDIHITGFEKHLPENVRCIRIQDIKADLKKDRYTASGFHWFNRLSKTDCGKKGIPFLELRVPHLSMKGPTLLKAWNEHEMHIQEFVIESPSLNIQETNRHHPPARKPLPQDLIRDLPFAFRVDSIRIDSGYIHFEKYMPEKEQSGYINFTAINATVKEVSNEAKRLEKNPFWQIEAEARFMDQAALNAWFKFDQRDTTGAYSFSARMGSMPMPAINTILEPLANLRFEEGNAVAFRADVFANRYRANGELVFEYENLKLALLDAEHQDKKLTNFFVNLLMVRKENLPQNKSYQSGSVDVVLEQNRSVFRHWWMSVRSGLISIAFPDIPG